MYGVELCPQCKVPKLFTQENFWLNNGDIVQGSSRDTRMAFMECENFDPLFREIGEIIGIPIEQVVVRITSRGIHSYLGHLVPPDTKELLRSMTPGDAALGEQCRLTIEAFNSADTMLAGIMGHGRYEVKGFSYERCDRDYSTIWVSQPYSLPFVTGSHAGHCAALVGGEHQVECREVLPGTYEFTSHWTELDDEIRHRMKLDGYEYREGDAGLEICTACGGPSALSGFTWYLDRGIIKNNHTGRRMAMLGPAMLDPVFHELESELGQTIPRVVVEAQRRFVKTGFYSIEEVRDEGDMRTQLALRGLGNLKEITMGRKGVRARIGNAVLHLMVVGLVQGLFEMAFGVDSTVEWETSGDGDLELEVAPLVSEGSAAPALVP